MKWGSLAGLVLAYGLLIAPFSNYLQNRPIEIKLGYLPDARIMKVASGEFSPLVAEWTITQVLFYYGSLIEKFRENVIIQPEYFRMYKSLETAVQLDPYNMDAYYFAQASFTWELNRARDVNSMLAYGMKYRTWDYWLPFYAGFNAAYFLKDYSAAAAYMQRAAELSGNSLFANLAARYFYESNSTELGLAFLDTMIAGAKDDAIRTSYEMRKEALLATLAIERAIADFQSRYGTAPMNLSALVDAGLLDDIPRDPYGGTFFVDSEGRVRSSSKFAAPGQ